MPDPSTETRKDSPEDHVIGSPELPAFKPRLALFLFTLVLFATWMTVLIVWAVRLRVGAS